MGPTRILYKDRPVPIYVDFYKVGAVSDVQFGSEKSIKRRKSLRVLR